MIIKNYLNDSLVTFGDIVSDDKISMNMEQKHKFNKSRKTKDKTGTLINMKPYNSKNHDSTGELGTPTKKSDKRKIFKKNRVLTS